MYMRLSTRHANPIAAGGLAFAGLIVAGLAAACSSPTGPADPDLNGRVLGTIDHYGTPTQATMPDTVLAGSDFEVAVLTYGGGCFAKLDTEVESSGSSATVTPYDRDGSVLLPPNTPCTDNLQIFRHEGVVRFDEIGPATVVIRGLTRPADEVILVTYSIEVVDELPAASE